MSTRRVLALCACLLLAGRAHAATRPTPAAPHSPPPVVNVNDSTETQLMFLPGVGATTAAWIQDRIIEKGPYTSVDQLADVKGIGPKKLARLRPYVVLNGPTTATEKIHIRKP